MMGVSMSVNKEVCAHGGETTRVRVNAPIPIAAGRGSGCPLMLADDCLLMMA